MAIGARLRRLLAPSPARVSLQIATDRVTGVALGRGAREVTAVSTASLPEGVLIASANASNLGDRAAVEAAVGAPNFLAVAAAKATASEAAGEAAAIAHQLHGAIGFTEEHYLHRYTKALWAWREEYGNEGEWNSRLGAQVTARGGAALWPEITRSGG